MSELGTKIGSLFFDVSASLVGLGDTVQQGLVDSITARTALVGGLLEGIGKKLFVRFTLPLAAAVAANVTTVSQK